MVSTVIRYALAMCCALTWVQSGHAQSGRDVVVDRNSFVQRCAAHGVWGYTLALKPGASSSAADLARVGERNARTCACRFDKARNNLAPRPLLLFSLTSGTEHDDAAQLFTAAERQVVSDYTSSVEGKLAPDCMAQMLR